MSDPLKIIAEHLDYMLSDIDVIGREEWLEENARTLHAMLTDTGVLLPPGGETREHYEVQTPGVRYPGGDREYIWRTFGELMGRGVDAQVVVQDVTTWPDGREHRTPWRPVPGSDS